MKAAQKVLMTLLLMVGVAGLWLFEFAGPVLWSFKERGNPSGEPSFSIFNPFRERASEARAEEVLTLLKDGHCDEVMRRIAAEEDARHICDQENQSKLDDWKLVGRTDASNMVRLYYRVRRASASNYTEGVWIELQKVTDAWRVVDISAIY